MFSGIIKNEGIVTDTFTEGSNKIFWIKSQLAPELHVDQSLSHNGVCLTVEEIKGDTYKVTAIEETLLKSNLGQLVTGQSVNLERSITMQTLLDGHIVQGHVDTIGDCIGFEENDGSHIFTFKYNFSFNDFIVEKGSVAVNGVSLTAFNCKDGQFSVGIVPYTFSHTNFRSLEVGDIVNLEFDIIGKYVKKIAANQA